MPLHTSIKAEQKNAIKATPVIKFSSFIWDNICGFDTRNPDIKNHKNKKAMLV
ncbi:hypothetical protein CHL_1110 [Campylobacter hyointestinalis subsp. lawsonii CCUG 27631]|nr:hypothetical protein CHL_1110 [Campylobacter hyointestinalis subsp. lawsonii CCUG 27631]